MVLDIISMCILFNGTIDTAWVYNVITWGIDDGILQ